MIFNVGPDGNVAADGVLQGASLVSIGPYGVSIYNDVQAKTAGIAQSGAMSGVSLTVNSASTTAKPIAVNNNAGTKTFYVNNNGFVSSAGISSSHSIYAANNIEAAGNMLCRAISTNGVNGISI